MTLRAQENRVIVGLGDSITAGNPGFHSPVEDPPEGSGNPESQYAYWMMQAHPEWRVLNRGVGGERTDEILARFDRDVLASKPNAVIVLAGINDLYQGNSAQSAIDNLSRIYARAEESGIRIIACTVMPYAGMGPRMRERLQQVNDWIRETSKAKHYGFCDLHAVMQDADQPGELAHTEDGVHPDVAGYREMAAALSGALEKTLQ